MSNKLLEKNWNYNYGLRSWKEHYFEPLYPWLPNLISYLLNIYESIISKTIDINRKFCTRVIRSIYTWEKKIGKFEWFN